MNRLDRLVVIVVVALVFVLPVIAQSSSRSRLLDEDAALALLDHTLKKDGVYTHRISLDCVTYITEERTNVYFQFVLREIHNAKCGGDPETNPVVDRYRAYRRSRKIEWLEPVEGEWRPYDPAKIR